MIASAADDASKFESLLVIESDVSESVGVSGVVIELRSLSTMY